MTPYGVSLNSNSRVMNSVPAEALNYAFLKEGEIAIDASTGSQYSVANGYLYKNGVLLTNTRLPVWTPRSISGIAGWWMAETYALADGGAIATNWLDQSGNGRDLVTTGANAVYRLNSINGRPAVDTGATAGNQTKTHWLYNSAFDWRQVFAVAYNSGVNITFDGLVTGVPAGGKSILIGANGTGLWYTTDVGGLTGTTGIFKDGTATNALTFGATGHLYNVGWTQDISATQAGIIIGKTKNELLRAWWGHIHEVIVFSAIISAADLLRLKAYFTAKYAITIA